MRHPWNSIDQSPPNLSWPNAPGWPPADALTPPANTPKPTFEAGDEVRVKDRDDDWYDRDGVIHSEVPDERGTSYDERYLVEGERGDPTQRRVYRKDQLEKRGAAPRQSTASQSTTHDPDDPEPMQY